MSATSQKYPANKSLAMYTLPKLITVLCLFVAAVFLVTVVEANPVNLAGTECPFCAVSVEW